MYRVLVRITLRPSILDPQGKAIAHALRDLGLPGVDDVRTGKHLALSIQADSEAAARDVATTASTRLLANPVTEDFEIVAVESMDPVAA